MHCEQKKYMIAKIFLESWNALNILCNCNKSNSCNKCVFAFLYNIFYDTEKKHPNILLLHMKKIQISETLRKLFLVDLLLFDRVFDNQLSD